MLATEYTRRRKKLMAAMDGGVAIVPSAPARLRNRDTEYAYRPDSDFYYLTGFGEPEAVAVLIPGRPEGEYLLFCRPRDAEKETWNGYRAGQEGAVRDHGADQAYPIEELDQRLPGLLQNRGKLYYSLGAQPEFDARVLGWVADLRARSRTGVQAPAEFIALEHLLHEQRLFKSRAELTVMRRAGRISAAAHVRAMRACRPGLWEYTLEAEVRHEFIRGGARQVAYEPIVGGGANGCILHYVSNNAPLRDGDLVLIDAGAEVDCYASDITRTFPINGRFSAEQAALYQVVLDSQLAAIAEVRPGNHWNAPHEAAVGVLTQGLVDLGLLEGDVGELIESGAYRRYYMHRTGHWLGMDVHDVGDYKVDEVWRALEPGMVTTVEPGLYVAANSPCAPRWWNIGIRIEDDVVVTRSGHEVLTGDAPKTIADVEALMAGR